MAGWFQMLKESINEQTLISKLLTNPSESKFYTDECVQYISNANQIFKLIEA